MERFQTTEVNTDGLFDYNPNLFFSGIALMAFSPIIFCLPCMCRSCFQKCKCSSCCKSGSALQSADQLAGDRKKNYFQHHYSIDSETGDVQPANNETGKNEFILRTTPYFYIFVKDGSKPLRVTWTIKNWLKTFHFTVNFYRVKSLPWNRSIWTWIIVNSFHERMHGRPWCIGSLTFSTFNAFFTIDAITSFVAFITFSWVFWWCWLWWRRLIHFYLIKNYLT